MFQKDKLIRFQHCDPAGVVFYPQYLILCHELMEDWFNEGLRDDYAAHVLKRRMGLPIVHLECDFLAPSRMGDTLAMRLGVIQLGVSSLTLSVHAWVNGSDCLKAVMKVVQAALDEHKSAPFSQELRTSMQRFETQEM